MLNSSQASKALLTVVPNITIQSYILYRDIYLFRVTFASPNEADYDPFFSVNSNTGEVRDFSVMTDGDLSEISALFLSKKEGGG